MKKYILATLAVVIAACCPALSAFAQNSTYSCGTYGMGSYSNNNCASGGQDETPPPTTTPGDSSGTGSTSNGGTGSTSGEPSDTPTTGNNGTEENGQPGKDELKDEGVKTDIHTPWFGLFGGYWPWIIFFLLLIVAAAILIGATWHRRKRQI